MTASEVKQLLSSVFPGASINVNGEDANYSVDVISAEFENMNRFNRQKKVLSSVKEQISSGEIHAFSVQVYTPQEWASNTTNLTVL